MVLRLQNSRRTLAAALAVLLAGGVGGCSDGANLGPVLADTKIGLRDLKSYRLGIGDKIRLNVFGESELSGTYEINPSGQISLPLVGEIKAAGLDTAGLRSAATQRLADGYLKKPRVTVEVVAYRPIYVHGEVRSGGEFPFKSGLRLRDVIAVAGGYTYRAQQGYVVLARDGLERPVKVKMPTDMLVMPGDNVRIPERFF